jgi:PleD family two-component response regulator
MACELPKDNVSGKKMGELRQLGATMARILSVSFDEQLLRTREMILEDIGHQVVSALGFRDAMKECQNAEAYELFILGHSIPHSDKEALISAFRARNRAPVIALKRADERPVNGADFEVEPEPNQVVKLVGRIMADKRPQPNS